MKRHCATGNALPETIVTMPVVLLFLFAAVNIALIGYLQAEADGSAYVGAHSIAGTPIASPSAQASTATNALQRVFPLVASAAVTAAQGATSAGVLVALKGPGIPLLSGAGAASTSINGHAFEPFVNATPAAYGSNVKLPVNSAVISPQGENYSVWLAQDSGSTTGRWGEFSCHQKYLNNITFPSSLVTAQANKNAYSTANSASFEYPIYQWDSTHSCA